MAKKVFVLTHVHEISPEQDDIKFLGVYSTEAKARSATARAKLLPGFQQIPEGFHVDAYELDKDYWPEGFVTVVANGPSEAGRRRTKQKLGERSAGKVRKGS